MIKTDAKSALEAATETLLSAGLFGVDAVTLDVEGAGSVDIANAHIQDLGADDTTDDDGLGVEADCIVSVRETDLPTGIRALGVGALSKATVAIGDDVFAVVGLPRRQRGEVQFRVDRRSPIARTREGYYSS